MNTIITPNAVPLAPPPATPLLTAEEFFEQHGDRQAELVKGLVRELPMPSFLHGRICLRVGRWLDEFADTHKLGRVVSNDTSLLIRRNPDTVYGPDVLYVSYERLPRDQQPDGMLKVIPELVVEVRSASDTWTAIFGKIGDYLAAGVSFVVVLDPDTQTATVYRPDALQTTYRLEQELVLPELFPGWAIPLLRLFEG